MSSFARDSVVMLGPRVMSTLVLASEAAVIAAEVEEEDDDEEEAAAVVADVEAAMGLGGATTVTAFCFAAVGGDDFFGGDAMGGLMFAFNLFSLNPISSSESL